MSFKQATDINGHLKSIGDQAKKQLGLEQDSEMWKMFDQYFDSILYSSNESHLKKIIESTIAGVYHFVESGNAD